METAKKMDQMEKKTSTIVDYVFFAIQESVKRGFSTGIRKVKKKDTLSLQKIQPTKFLFQVVCNVIEMVSHILEENYLSYLNEVLEEEYDDIAHSEAQLKAMDSNLLMSVLNNLELSQKYLGN